MSYSRFIIPSHTPFVLLLMPGWGLRWLAWALFGNVDDGQTSPHDYQTSRPDWLRAILWWLRSRISRVCANTEPHRCLSYFWPEAPVFMRAAGR